MTENWDPIKSLINSSIDDAFSVFKSKHPDIESLFNQEILNYFRDFIAFFFIGYQEEGELDISETVEELKKSNPDFDFQMSPLMQSALEIAAFRFRRDYIMIIDEAHELQEDVDEDWDDLIDEANFSIEQDINIKKCFEELIKVQMQKDGMKKTFHENGQLKSEGKWENDKPVGEHKRWYDNGQLLSVENYKEGKEEGKWEGYYENGQLGGTINYKEGKLDGLKSVWDEDGNLLIETEWKDGKEIFKPNVLPTIYFKRIEIYDQGGDVTNQDSGETCNLNSIELSIYDAVMGSKTHMEMMGPRKESIETLNTGLEWFKETNPDAYRILFK